MICRVLVQTYEQITSLYNDGKRSEAALPHKADVCQCERSIALARVALLTTGWLALAAPGPSSLAGTSRAALQDPSVSAVAIPPVPGAEASELLTQPEFVA